MPVHLGAGDMSMRLRTLKWQTLQDASAPIVPPYDRLPQWQWRYAPQQLAGGLDASVELDATRFRRHGADRAAQCAAQLRAGRSAARSWRRRALSRHACSARQQLPVRRPAAQRCARPAAPCPPSAWTAAWCSSATRSYFGRAFVQTLEPRAFYTYTPYRDQSMLPVYDTAANDFNFATIYTENAYGGHDRIADNNLLTLGLTTRLLDPTPAPARASALPSGCAFPTRTSPCPETPVSERLSDVMLGAAINWTPQWGFDSTVQYNPKTRRSIRSTSAPATARRLPWSARPTACSAAPASRSTWAGSGRSTACGARRTRPPAPAPAARWYSVGRLNYSLQDRKLVDTVVGFEYDSCCWIGRVVLERLQNSRSTSNTRLLFQIEFVGFSRLSLGSNPCPASSRTFPATATCVTRQHPSRFSNYD
jgi:LPS-assembly protein